MRRTYSQPDRRSTCTLQIDGKTVRPLGGGSDRAIALLNALEDAHRKQAILSFRLTDLVLGPGQDGKTIQPEGLKASAMTERQRRMLIDLISEWSGIVNESAAAARIQGPHLVIEYAPQRLGGNPALHVHTMYRDPTNDYGRKFTAK